MKYIVVFYDDKEHIFIFPKNINHNFMLETIEVVKIGYSGNWKRLRSKYDDFELVSAGFIMNGKCYGRSETLDINSRPKEDTNLYNESMVNTVS